MNKISALREQLQQRFETATKHKERNSEIRAAEPTYPAGKTVPADKAREMVEQYQREFFRDAAEWHRKIAKIEQTEEEAGAAARPLPPVHGMRSTTGVGKTEKIVEGIAEEPLTKPPAIAVPTHKLGEEIVPKIIKEGRTARLIRGRNAIDPDAPENQNLPDDFPDEQKIRKCRNLDQVELAIACGAPVSTTCCKYKPKGQPEQRCKLFDTCAYQEQFLNPPEAWIIAHELMFHEHGGIGKISMLIGDENFWRKGIFESEKGLLLDDIVTKGSGDPDLDSMRGYLVDALRAQPVGGLKRESIIKEFSAYACTEALRLEWKVAKLPELWPGMTKAQVAKAMKRAPTIKTQKLTGIWKELRDLIEDSSIEVSGRLVIERNRKGATLIKHHGIKQVRKQWQVPTLLMSATLPGPSILKAFHPQIKILPDIEAAMPPYVRIRQILNAPVTGTKLQLMHGEKTGGGKHHLKSLRRYILKRWIESGRQKLLVICQKEAEERLRQLEKKMGKLPENIHIEHFNRIEGLDQYRDVRTLILIGRTIPRPDKIETMTGALTGHEPVKAPLAPSGRYRWYVPVTRGIRLTDEAAARMGMPGVAVVCDEHPDPDAEAVRWQVCEGELVQALGRARAINRKAETPLDIDILADVALPVGVDEVSIWEEPSEIVEAWASDSVILSSTTDMVKAWPHVWPYVRAADRTLAGLGTLFRAIADHRDKSLSFLGGPDAEHRDKSLLRYTIGFCRDVHTATYQLVGPKQKLREVLFDPSGVANLRALFVEKLSAIPKFLGYHLWRRDIEPMAGAGKLNIDDAKVTVLKRAWETLDQLFDRAARHPWRKLPEAERAPSKPRYKLSPDYQQQPTYTGNGRAGRYTLAKDYQTMPTYDGSPGGSPPHTSTPTAICPSNCACALWAPRECQRSGA